MNQANFLQSLGWAIINSLWQLALLWLVYQLITSLFSKWGAASRSRLAAVLLISGFGWFIYTFFTTLGNEDSVITYFSFSAAESLAVNDWLGRILPAASVDTCCFVYRFFVLSGITGMYRLSVNMGFQDLQQTGVFL